MNKPVYPLTRASACPHDCPSTCALEVDVLGPSTIGRVRGAADNAYTDGVICAKVARYADRTHHPDRLTRPLRRVGEGRFEPMSWDDALDLVAEKFLKAEQALGSETVWPYHYAGTMGLVQRDSIHRLRHTKRYSGQFDTICTNNAWTGYIAGTGLLAGPDPREMALADCVVIWGTNAVSTQINVMTHAVKARKSRGAKIVVIDVYNTGTMKQADMGLVLKPGTDAALACAAMHVLFRDGLADWDYLRRYTDCPDDLAEHVKSRTPEWAAAITGLSVAEIEAFAHLVGNTKRSYFRLGYGFTRSRNGTVSMHAAASIACVTGCWQYEGGGAFHNNGAIYKLDKRMIEAPERRDPSVRLLDQSRIGAILCSEPEALEGGPPVTAMLVQNTNPVSVAPEQEKVKRGFARDDLFVCVHEQFMTETAAMADVVLPATSFVEHDDIYKGGGHQYLQLGPKLIDGPGEARENLFVLNELMTRLGVEHPGNALSAREHIDWMLKASGYGDWDTLERDRWLDLQPEFRQAHYLDGFGHADKKFHFRPDWTKTPAPNDGAKGPWSDMPELPDFWPVIEDSDATHPFRLVTAPARSFLNSTFNETEGSRKKEGRPEVLLHPDEAARIGVGEGDAIRMGNERGAVRLHARIFDGVLPGVVVSEGIWPNSAFVDGRGINTLTGADPTAPYGGAAFHDSHVWIRLD
ncbi:molybdopterin oxidoreductase family protein [Breoghania sp. L-A4]|uniref:molybdopterin oxidoreductase family protein n=1 Tax=Breoghania sp. L-A4 TaxID=2304600 RepID=UPI000E359743|nr:molybdopterin oxidoreductase family protein [Breoghania sp. L-A4]AXS40617.1 molybdopterin oxidoreductase family protein [Breoghania sp. L-A4]